MSEKHDEKNTNWQKRSISKFLENEENAGGDGGTIQRTLHLETFEAEQLWTSLQMTVKHVEKNTNLIKNFLQQQLKD